MTDAAGVTRHQGIEYAEVPGFWDGADDVPGIVARSAAFVRSLAPGPAAITP